MSTVRRDLFGVMVWNGFWQQWEYKAIYDDRKAAFKASRYEKRKAILVKVVHPRQELVDSFICHGNTIKNWAQ